MAFSGKEQFDAWNDLLLLERIGAAEIDPITGWHLSASPMFCRITGYTHEELVERSVLEYIDAADHGVLEKLQRTNPAVGNRGGEGEAEGWIGCALPHRMEAATAVESAGGSRLAAGH